MTDETTYTSDLDYTGQPRHLMVFLDGTWNDENGKENNGVVTNIFKLFSCLQGTRDFSDVPFRIENENQVGLYFRGVGNDEDNSTFGTYYEGAFGSGEKRIRDHSYTEVVKHYRKGDRISIFGFSRGAACSRLLATKICEHGIPQRIVAVSKKVENPNSGNMETAFKKYRDVDGPKIDTDIHFLGLLDTVGAFGIPVNIGPFKLQKLNLFRNLSIADKVLQAVHCVAIDESREPFLPTLCNSSTRVDEVWFPGVHADIGGGYRYATLGKITLDYLVTRFRMQNSDHQVQMDEEALRAHTEYDVSSDEILMHYHGDGIKKYPRDIVVMQEDEPSATSPRVHSSAFDLMESENVAVAETLNSFIKCTPVKYRPKNIRNTGAPIETV